MMQFEFATAGQIIFGAGKLRSAGTTIKNGGKRPLVVTGKNIQRAEPLRALLRENNVEGVTFSVSGEPSIQTVRDGVALAKKENCDWVIGMGGGSVLDAGKAIAAMMTNEGDVLEYLEIIGQGKPLAKRPALFLAIPTTAGTGSEVTRNAVLSSPEHKLKVSLRSASMIPAVALVDPELTYDLPRNITASTGLDALTQLIEPYVCLRANPMTDPLCVDGMRYVAKSFRAVMKHGQDKEARAQHGARKFVRRNGAGQCRPRRGAWICRPHRWNVFRAARGNLRCVVAACHGDEPARAARTRAEK